MSVKRRYEKTHEKKGPNLSTRTQRYETLNVHNCVYIIFMTFQGLEGGET